MTQKEWDGIIVRLLEKLAILCISAAVTLGLLLLVWELAS